jgi:hypothetical protein
MQTVIVICGQRHEQHYDKGQMPKWSYWVLPEVPVGRCPPAVAVVVGVSPWSPEVKMTLTDKLMSMTTKTKKAA